MTHTNKELAKMASVGTGTIARYNRVMNSDDEELKKTILFHNMHFGYGLQYLSIVTY